MSDELPWEDGIIGKLERFFLDRYPIGKMYARALPTSLVSASLHNIHLRDKMGDVRPNLWFLYVAESGLGYKTPALKMLREVAMKFNKHIVSISKFTPEGYTEWVMGVNNKRKKVTTTKDGVETVKVTESDRNDVVAHPFNYIIRDEMSKLLGESTNYRHLATVKEYLSELWDGWIEGYYTRKWQYEGNVPVYVTLVSASSDIFLHLLDESFFKQGCGCRILWIIEESPEPKELGDDFFFPSGEQDAEWEELKEETVKRLKPISNLLGAWITREARKLWIVYQHECAMKAYTIKGVSGSFEVKQPLNALKLAICYSASRLSVTPHNFINVKEEDMKRAIEDAKTYVGMWGKAMNWWRRIKDERPPERIRTSKYDLVTFMKLAMGKKGLICIAEIMAEFDITDRLKIGKVLALGITKGWLEIAAEVNKQGSLTPKEYKRFKPERGTSPQVFKVTEEGKNPENYKP